MTKRKQKFIIYAPGLSFKSGGFVVLHQLANDLLQLGHHAMLYNPNEETYQNIFCNNFAGMDDVDDSAVVVYPEIIEGNPLRAKNVVRWILCDIGKNSSTEITKTWKAEDLVFHYSTFNSHYDPSSVEVLFTTWIHPAIENKKLKRSGSCYLFKKASLFHKSINLIHPKDALMIDPCSPEEIIEIFNRKEYFFSYDPYSFYDVIALLCGCIPVIYPMTNVSKLEWLKTRASFQLQAHVKGNLSGLAYGIDDIPYAKESLIDAEKEQKANHEFSKKTVVNFINVVDDYFFGQKKLHPYKTVAEVSKSHQWGYSLKDSFGELIEQKESEIRYLHSQIRNQEKENKELRMQIKLMKASKFWIILRGVKNLMKL